MVNKFFAIYIVVFLPICLSIISNYLYDWIKSGYRPALNSRLAVHVVASFAISILFCATVQILLVVLPGLYNGKIDDGALVVANMVTVASPLCAIIAAFLVPWKSFARSFVIGFFSTLISCLWIIVVFGMVIPVYRWLATI